MPHELCIAYKLQFCRLYMLLYILDRTYCDQEQES